MAGNSISFLVTYRGRPDLLLGYIQNVRKFYPEEEIVVSGQANSKVFLQGQLFNLAFPYSTGNIVVLMDIDIRFYDFVDFKQHMEMINWPFMGYDRIFDCDERGRKLGVRPGTDRTHGGCSVFTREQFIQSCGYSNLLCDWGADDDVLDIRVGGFRRIHNDLWHVQHKKRKNVDTYIGNSDLYKTESCRDKSKDGYKQTCAKLITKEIIHNVICLKFDEIGVTSDFAYIELLRKF
jgi:glycosyltransferase involved in cell wall biosynthesis